MGLQLTLPRVTIYRVICERLEAIARVTDAIECFLAMMSELGGEVYTSDPMTEWVSGNFMFYLLSAIYIECFWSDFTHRRLSALRSDGDSPIPTPLIREWAKATLARTSWKDALVAVAGVSIFVWSSTHREIDTPMVLQFTLPRVTIYRVICERLEAIDRVTDVIECFLEMISELGEEVYTSEPMTEWLSGDFMFYLSVCHIFNAFGQISPTDVSPLSGATVTRRSLHHF
jgi:hypothetical protein